MNDGPLFRRYFRWLYSKVCTDRDIESPHSYTLVCDIMHQIPFKALVAMDDNRMADGAELRDVFLSRYTRGEAADIDTPITIFEVLVALAGRAMTMNGMSEDEWFRIFLVNLGLERYSDKYVIDRPTWRINRKLKTFNDRTYKPDGEGGLFPLTRPLRDQRRVELWYQMGAFMTENDLY